MEGESTENTPNAITDKGKVGTTKPTKKEKMQMKMIEDDAKSSNHTHQQHLISQASANGWEPKLKKPSKTDRIIPGPLELESSIADDSTSEDATKKDAPPRGVAKNQMPEGTLPKDTSPMEGPSGDTSPTEGPSGDTPPTEGPSGDTPSLEGPSGDTPPTEGPSGDTPPTEGTSGDTPPTEGTSGESQPGGNVQHHMATLGEEHQHAIYDMQMLVRKANEGKKGLLLWTMLHDVEILVGKIKEEADQKSMSISVTVSCPTKRSIYSAMGIHKKQDTQIMIFDDAAAIETTFSSDLVVFITAQGKVNLRQIEDDRVVRSKEWNWNIPHPRFIELAPVHRSAPLGIHSHICPRSHIQDIIHASDETVAQLHALVSAAAMFPNHSSTAFIFQYPRFSKNYQKHEMLEFLRTHCCNIKHLYGFPALESDDGISHKHVVVCFQPPTATIYTKAAKHYNMATLMSMLPAGEMLRDVSLLYHVSPLYV